MSNRRQIAASLVGLAALVGAFVVAGLRHGQESGLTVVPRAGLP